MTENIIEEEEKQKLLQKMIQDEIINSGINFGQTIIEFGCLNYDGAFLKNITSYNGIIDYTGVDADGESLEKFKNQFKNENLKFLNSSMQEYLDSFDEMTQTKPDWFIISGLFDSPIYEENQYNFLDIILKKCLENSNIGVSFIFDNSKSDKDYYNIDYISGYIHTGFYRYKIVRFNEKDYLVTIYKYFLETN